MKKILTFIAITLFLYSCSSIKENREQSVLNFTPCKKVQFEKYCQETENGVRHIVKELARFGLEAYTKMEIKNLCSQHYDAWGYSYLAPVDERINLICHGEKEDGVLSHNCAYKTDSKKGTCPERLYPNYSN